MPVAVSYPGVYIEEISSGVRTITGVSTSVTAFVGFAKRGPINKTIRILSYSDYERRFGGLQVDSYMSYAVRQFFLNGGTEAWIVRVAGNPQSAFNELRNTDDTKVLRLTASDDGIAGQGKAGKDIEVRVDYNTSNPKSTFNLTLNYVSKDNPTDSFLERFENLSMNSEDARYAVDIIDASRLVKAERLVNDPNVLNQLKPGTSVSGELQDVNKLIVVDKYDQIRISINGSSPIPVQLRAIDVEGVDDNARLDKICIRILIVVQNAANGDEAIQKFKCLRADKTIKMESGKGGELSSVRVLPGERNDASVNLKLGSANGGTEEDAVAGLRPKEIPDHGTLKSDVIAAVSVPDADHNRLKISLDGLPTQTVYIGDTAPTGDLDKQLDEIATRIQNEVRKLDLSREAYKNFTCTRDQHFLMLASGTRGQGSSISVSPADKQSVAAELKLLAGATLTPAVDVMLTDGKEDQYKLDSPIPSSLFTGDRANRKGIYALEAVDLFNLLCLPGIEDANILMDAAAYCKERRAFLIVDGPNLKEKPSDMESVIRGTQLPKSDYAAVYYPWLKMADPLKNGKLRLFPPSGTIAGLYGRTDSARGVWKAPAGTEATLVGVQDVAYLLTDGENGTLNPLGVNCIRVFPTFGAIAWGARTLRGADQMTSEYKYIPVRRTALFIEESLYRGLKWVVFEPNDEPLWAQIRLNVGAFMQNLFRQGAFQGKTPREAYFVKCDRETTTQNDINLGIVNIVVGFAPLKPAEFVIIKLQQMAGQIET